MRIYPIDLILFSIQKNASVAFFRDIPKKLSGGKNDHGLPPLKLSDGNQLLSLDALINKSKVIDPNRIVVAFLSKFVLRPGRNDFIEDD